MANEFDFTGISGYRESNRLEAKKAQAGLPESLWATYSAFANTSGGLILLGVEELADHSLRVCGVDNPVNLMRDFWNIINNQNKVSLNILTDSDVTVERVRNKTIIVIRVPRAARNDKPIYLNQSVLTATYRRNGEGDYRCSKAEVQAMLRDAAPQTQDMKLLEDKPLSVINADSLRRYRIRMRNQRPGHVWEELDDAGFLYRIGAAGRDKMGQLHPTAAGLLMFGNEYEIITEFPYFFLDYREKLDPGMRWTDRVISSSGDWSGNIFDFYFRVIDRLLEAVKLPFALNGIERVENTPLHGALREALANCMIHADYYGEQGVVVVREPDRLTFANPGSLRIELPTAMQGGVSEPRNVLLMKMFNLIDIGERAGSGIPSIREVWKRCFGSDLSILEQFEPDRVTLCLTLPVAGDVSGDKSGNGGANGDKNGDKSPKIDVVGDKTGDKTRAGDEPLSDRLALIQDYIREHGSVGCAEIAEFLKLKASRTRELLTQLIGAGVLVAEGSNKNRRYLLKLEKPDGV